MKKVVIVLCVVAGVLAPRAADAQPLARNAALRYWMAFAYMQNPPADQDTSELLELVASGKAAWDEARLGKILDANTEALGILQRGTIIDECDWGIEYDLGSAAPIAYIAKARVLGRLNILEGLRLQARGQANQAAETLLTNIRFSQHVAVNGTLLSVLVAGALMSQSLDALTRLGPDARLDASHRQQIASRVTSLPEDGLDWDGAWQRETALVEAERRKNPGAPHELASRTGTDRAIEELRAARQRVLDAFGRRTRFF